MDIHNSIMDIHNQLWISIIELCIMNIHDLIMDIHNLIIITGFVRFWLSYKWTIQLNINDKCNLT